MISIKFNVSETGKSGAREFSSLRDLFSAKEYMETLTSSAAKSFVDAANKWINDNVDKASKKGEG